jgi:hypothetical protein
MNEWAIEQHHLDSYRAIVRFLNRGIKDPNNPPKTIDPCDRPAGMNNTRVIRKKGAMGYCAIKYHDTEIVKYFPNEVIELNTDGWFTYSTRERMNAFQNRFQVYTNQRIMYLSYYDKTYLYQDHMVLHPNGTVTINDSIIPPITKQSLKKKVKLKSKVNDYVKQFMDKFFNHEINRPSKGDCFYCQGMVDKAEVINDNIVIKGKCDDGDHIISHIKQKYFVPTLLVNALNENEEIGIYGLAPIDKHNIAYYFKENGWEETQPMMSDMTRKRLTLILKRYINKRVGLGVT